MKKDFVYIAIFLLIATVFYFFYIPFPSLWADESLAVNISKLPIGQLVNNLLSIQAHPPAYYLLIKGWGMFFGDSEFALRFPSFLFFLLLTIAVYFLAKELFNDTVAKYSLPFSSTNHFLIFFSHQVRPYEMLAFISAVSFYFFVKINKEFNLKSAAGYLLFTIIGLYTHYWFVLVFIAQGLIALIMWRSVDLKKIYLTMFIAGVSFLPWIISYLRIYRSYYVSEGIPPPNLNMLWQSIQFMAWGQALPILAVSGIVLFLAALAKVSIRMSGFQKAATLIYWVFPIVLAYLISEFLPIYTPGRREIIVIPPLIILLAFIFSRLDFQGWLIIVSSILIIFAIQPIFNSNATMKSFESNDKMILNAIFDEIKSGDALILSGFSGSNFTYYWNRYNKNERKKAVIIFYIPPKIDVPPLELEMVKELASNKIEFQKILNNITSEINKEKSGNIYLFLSDERLNKILIDFFNNNYRLNGEIIPKQPAMPTYITGIVKYSN